MEVTRTSTTRSDSRLRPVWVCRCGSWATSWWTSRGCGWQPSRTKPAGEAVAESGPCRSPSSPEGRQHHRRGNRTTKQSTGIWKRWSGDGAGDQKQLGACRSGKGRVAPTFSLAAVVLTCSSTCGGRDCSRLCAGDEGASSESCHGQQPSHSASQMSKSDRHTGR